MQPTDSFLVGRPRLKVDGQLRAGLGEAALALNVHLPLSGMASAELRVLNWGVSGGGDPDFQFQDLRLGARLEVLAGEGETPLFKGDITGLEERYGDGAPQLVILAEDALHKLARARQSRAFEDMSIDDVVSQVAGDAGLSGDAQVCSATGTWLQMNESALAFLLRLLAPHDVGLRVAGTQLRARDEEDDPEPLTLDPGRNAERIRLIADLNHQPRGVDVAGWNLAADSEAEGSAEALTPAPQGESAGDILGRLGWQGASVSPHPFPRSAAEAQALAKKRFRQRARRFVHGEIVCRDAGQLAGGRQVELTGVSPRLAGRYRVVDCWHQFDTLRGLSTRIRVERPDWSAE